MPPPPPPSLVGAYYLQPPDARAIFLHNDLLCNDTCSVTGGSITYWGGTNGKDPPSELNLFFFETKRGHEHTPRLISKTTTEEEFLIADEPTKDEEFFFQGFSDVTRPRRPDIFFVTDVTKRWSPEVPDVTLEVLSPVRRIQTKRDFFATKNLKHTKIVPQRAFGRWFMKEIAVSNYKSACNEKKTQIARKNDIAFFAPEKLKNNFLNLSQKIYMKVKFLFE